MLPELSETKIITWNLHVFNETTKYDMTIGRDLLQDLGILSMLKDQFITWEDISIPMRDPNTSTEESYIIHESEILYEAMKRTKQILEAKYEPVTPQEIINGCDHLDSEEKQELPVLLEKLKDLLMEAWAPGGVKSLA